MAEPSCWEPSESLRPPPPERLIHQFPAVNVSAPTSVSAPTTATSACSMASSMSSNETEPINTPVPSAMMIANTSRLGGRT